MAPFNTRKGNFLITMLFNCTTHHIGLVGLNLVADNTLGQIGNGGFSCRSPSGTR